jgi:uncharacterized membrane protein
MIWLGIILFFGLHIMPSVGTMRGNLIARVGEKPYKGIYALISLAGLVLMIMGYGNMDYVELWPTPKGASHLALAVMPFVWILWVAAEMKGHIRKKTRHPMLVGVVLWTLVHLINNGDQASVILFGSFLLYALFAIVSANRRGKIPTYEVTGASNDIKAVVVGLVAFAAVLWGHEFLFGVAPVF